MIKLTLEEKPNRYSVPKDYLVMYGEKEIGEVYFNMRGYVGFIDSPQLSFGLGECGISNYKRQLPRLNRQAAALTKVNGLYFL